MGRLVAKTKLDNTGFKAGIGGMKGEVKGFQSQLGALKGVIAGAFAIGGLVRLTRSAIAAGSTLTDLALQTGLTTDEFQALELTAINAGTPMEKIRGVLTKVSVVLGQAKSGMKTYVDLFNKAGISTERLATLDTPGALKAIADEMQGATEGSVKFGAILEILGTRSGIQLREVLTELSNTTLPGLIDRFKETGDIIDNNLLQLMDASEDSMQRFARRMKFAIGGAVTKTAAGFVVFGKTLKGIFVDFKGGEKAFSDAADSVFLLGTASLKSADAIDAINRAAAKAQELKIPKVIDEADVKLVSELAALMEKRRKEQLSLNEKIAEEKKLLADIKVDLSAEGQTKNAILQLKIDELGIQEKLNKLQKEATKESEKKAKVDQKENQILEKADKKLDEIGKGITVSPALADRLATIGGQIGGAVSPAARSAERATQLDERRNALLREVKQQLIENRVEDGLA